MSVDFYRCYYMFLGHEMYSETSWKNCVYNSSIDYVGNRQEEATINLGYGTEDEIKAFFSQIKPGVSSVIVYL